MGTGPAPLSKITRPRLQKFLVRTRLFSLLEKGRSFPAVWISGPGGSGKTTLAASYIEELGLSSVWYQADQRDSDIATFFYYLGQACSSRTRGESRPLPLFTPEYALGISTFARRFFEKFFERLEKPGVLVLDNYQEAGDRSLLDEVVREALETVPGGVNVFILSRTEPPPAFARPKASRLLYEIGWRDLKLDPRETRDLVSLLARTRPRGKAIDYIQEKTEGWAAGVVLLLKRAEAGALKPESMKLLTASGVSDYFTSEIFEKADKGTREFLLKTSVFPLMNAEMAESLTGREDAEAVLRGMIRNHWFTERYQGNETWYQYHPLFREYLLNRAGNEYSRKETARLKERAAELLEQDGQTDSAVELLFEAGKTEQAVSMVLSRAEQLTTQGRFHTLTNWLSRIPAEAAERRPEILYWLGVCRSRLDPEAARQLFEKALAIFEAREERAGICLSLCGVLDSISYGFSTFRSFDRWIPRLSRLSGGLEKIPSREAEIRLIPSALLSLTLRQPNHPGFAAWEKRGLAALKQQAPAYIKLRIVMALASRRALKGELEEAGYFIGLHQQLADSSGIPPVVLISLNHLKSFYYFLGGELEECLHYAEKALEKASETGINIFSPLAAGHAAACALSTGNADEADKYLRKMRNYSDYSSGWTTEYFHTLGIWKALLEKDLSRALLNSELAAEYIEETGMVLTEPVCRLGTALALHASGRQEEAEQQLGQALAISRREEIKQVEFACCLARAEFALGSGSDEDEHCWLRAGMEAGRKGGYYNTWFWRPVVMADLCCRALEKGIEKEYVKQLIRRRSLVPDRPLLEIEDWPWPVRVYTLGRFSIVKDGKPLRFKRRVQEKPLALLKAVIELGGRDVSEDRILDLLWPDADGDAASGAFKTTLHRLRRLLGSRDALTLYSGSLTLEPEYCWVDAWVFERMLSDAEAAGQSAQSPEDEVRAADLTRKALYLYKGQLFESEENRIIALREYLHHRFFRAAGRLGKYLQKTGRWEEALELYESSLKIDNLAEPFYRGLMICSTRLGKSAAAMAAYERCRSVLAERLGIHPSPETESLKENLFSRKN